VNIRHALVIPLYGALPATLPLRLAAFQRAGALVVLVLNDPHADALPSTLQTLDSPALDSWLQVVVNCNRGGVAGGFNRGVERAIAIGAEWITLLDQDSDLSPLHLHRLREPWQSLGALRLVVGPRIWDVRRRCWQGQRLSPEPMTWIPTRLLISSGTTFRAADWPHLGPMCEWLVVDFVDHAWSFQVQARGFELLQHPGVRLDQQFGVRHPNPLCRLLGMELYPPRRHFYGLRNLRWLLHRPEIPLDLKLKEALKMLFKPWLWLLFEPDRSANVQAIVRALCATVPPPEAE
jgi:rhamnosyltransferase